MRSWTQRRDCVVEEIRAQVLQGPAGTWTCEAPRW
jgi:hypothetical protein